MHRPTGDRGGLRDRQTHDGNRRALGGKSPLGQALACGADRVRLALRGFPEHRTHAVHAAVRVPRHRAVRAAEAHRAVLCLAALHTRAQHDRGGVFLVRTAPVEAQLGQEHIVREPEVLRKRRAVAAHQRAQVGVQSGRTAVILPYLEAEIAQKEQIDHKKYADEHIFYFIPLQALSPPFTQPDRASCRTAPGRKRRFPCGMPPSCCAHRAKRRPPPALPGGASGSPLSRRSAAS